MILFPDFAALFAASPYPYLLVDTGFDIIGANPAYLSATGRTADELVGKNIFDAFPRNPDDPGSTNLDEVCLSIERAISTRKPHTSALLRYAIPNRTPEGTGFEERYWSAIHTPVFDASGEVIFVAQNAIDVTELYRFDASTEKYYLKHGANAVPDVAQLNRPQMHEAMRRILDVERGQLQTLFNQAPGFIAVLAGSDHVFEIVNDAYYQLVGHRAILGKPALEALPELAGQGFKELLAGAYETGEPIVVRDHKVTLQRQSGGPLEDRFVDLLYQPIFGPDRQVTGIFAQGNDVTLAYRAKLALAEKVQQLEEIQARQAFQLRLADRLRLLGDTDEISAAACEMLGRQLGASRVLYAEIDDARSMVSIRRDWTVEGFASLAGLHRPMADFGPGLVKTLRAGITFLTHDVARDPRTAGHLDAFDEIGVRAVLLIPLIKNGRLRLVLTIQQAVPRAWTGDECRLAEEMAERTWLAIEAAQAQAQLRVERDQSQYIFDSMAEGFAVLDRHWTVLRMNAEGLRITQRSVAEVIGRNHWDIWPELKGTSTEAVYKKVIETRKADIVEISHTPPDGRQFWVEIRAYPSLDGGIAFFFRDITERRAAQEQLKIADRRKDEFLAMLAHELRNPLAPIGAAAELLQLARLDENQVRRTSQIIGRQVDHMTHLINDLLDVSRVTRGLVTLDNAPLDIGQIVAEAVEQVTPLMQSRRHHLALDLSREPALVTGDRKRLVQVIANILNNAAKYTADGGSILLRTAVEEAQIVIEVVDNGIGMSPELAGHVFELFAQAERTSDRSAGGLGLGLALVKSLVELHGGTAACHSQGIGHGSRFSVRLPRLFADDRPDGGAVVAGAMRRSERSLRILVVDDNVDAATMLTLLLEAAGHRVTVEHGPHQGLARAAEEIFDACLLDIGLPEMDGNELARRLRRLPQTAGAVLVAVTGYGQEEDRRRTRAAGFDHHLVKPLESKLLVAILDRIEPARPAGAGSP
jgi:PAS domain S-box-containing protein